MNEIAILVADHALAAEVGEDVAGAAREQATAAVREIEPRTWFPQRDYPDGQGWIGLLIIDGYVLRRLAIGHEEMVELLGPGDIIRPWDHDSEYSLPSVEVAFEVVNPIRIALLDADFAERVAAWPAIGSALMARLGQRSRWLATRIAISQMRRLDARLLGLFNHLGERWGEQLDGARLVPLRLSHDTLARLVGGSRPSVTAALGKLRSEGHVRPTDDGWIVADSARDVIARLAQS